MGICERTVSLSLSTRGQNGTNIYRQLWAHFTSFHRKIRQSTFLKTIMHFSGGGEAVSGYAWGFLCARAWVAASLLPDSRNSRDSKPALPLPRSTSPLFARVSASVSFTTGRRPRRAVQFQHRSRSLFRGARSHSAETTQAVHDIIRQTCTSACTRDKSADAGRDTAEHRRQGRPVRRQRSTPHLSAEPEGLNTREYYCNWH